MGSHARLELDAGMRAETDSAMDVLNQAEASLQAAAHCRVAGCTGCVAMHDAVTQCFRLLEETRRRFYRFSVAHHASVTPMLTEEEVECIRANNGLLPEL
jgi:hypothetical protein